MDFNKYPGASYGYGGFFEQKPPVPPPIAKAPNVMNYGWGMTPGMPANINMSNQYGGQWMVPPQSAAPHHPSFPKKTRGGFGYPGRGNKRPLYQQQPKPFDPTGKTPAMLLHELFKEGISEKYEEVSTPQAKKYKCVLTYGGQEYSHDANSKKVAKQKAAEVMIRGLRPEIQFTPFEETTSAAPTKKVAPASNAPPAFNPYSQFVQPGAFAQAVPPPLPPAPILPTQPKKSGPPQKKAKIQVPALEAALSLVDALRKLCLERAASGPYNPSFEFEEISEAGVTEKFKKYVCILSFPEKNIRFTAEAVGRAAPKDLVCLKALKEEFGVTEKDIRAIMRRNVMGKGGTMPVVQTLHHVASLCHCTVVFKTETVEPSIGIGTGKQLGYTSELTLTDHTQNDKVVVMVGEIGMSKHEAKESVCRKMLKEHFDIDVDQVNETVQAVPPCQDLQVRCAKKYKNNNSILFEDLGTVGVKDHASYGFKFKVVVEGKEFFGTGPSKKEAKNAAAREALACFFSDSAGVEEESEPEPCSRECHDLTQYVIKEHMNMRNFFGMHDQAPSRFAAFVFKNAEGCKRMVSLSAVSVPSVTSGELVVNSEGTVLHHMDSIVLARRGLIRYLIANMEQFDPAAPNNILERTENGKFRVRNDMQLILYTSFAPPLQNCKLGTEKPSLPLFGANSMEAIIPESPVTMEEIIVNKNVTSHSPSDKILKWTHLGVQGALLSLIMEPVLLSRIYVASRSNILSNDDLMHAFFTRTGEPTREVHAEFASNWFIPYPGPQKYSYVKLEPAGTVEHLDVTGKQVDGEESILSKRSIYQNFLEIYPELAKDMPYQSAKAQATEYNSSKHMLYLHMENRGYGKWQTKPSELSNFSLEDTAPSEVKSEDTSKIDFSLDA